MIEIDGTRYSGSGTIIRHAVALSALTGRDVRVVNARASRPDPGLRPAHTWIVEGIRRAVEGVTYGNCVHSEELVFRPGQTGRFRPEYVWDVGPSGSTTLMALAVLPLLAFSPTPVHVELRGGIFQELAPSFYHLRHVVLPVLRKMGVKADLRMRRPGFVPGGKGLLHLEVAPMSGHLQPLTAAVPGKVERVWGVTIASKMDARKPGVRMARAAMSALGAEGYEADFEMVLDKTSLQRGAAMAVFADLEAGTRLGSDRTIRPRQRPESVGVRVARQLVQEINSGASIDRYAADQLIIFAALADGESRFKVPKVTEHLQAVAWLAGEFLGAEVRTFGREISVEGIGFAPEAATESAGLLVGA